MKNTIDRNASASSNSNAGLGPFHYVISIKFIDRSDISAQLDIFDSIKKLGALRVQDQKNHIYILDFRSSLTKDEMEKRLKEFAGPAGLFDYTIKE